MMSLDDNDSARGLAYGARFGGLIAGLILAVFLQGLVRFPAFRSASRP